ncbi:acyltransferase [Bradyrhizobium sp. 193]|uniref:acyltransferase n=1 Tax=Bradyrhizobium sp. 193 TaxID=2782661 RepID=UPI001FFAEDEE|nr:acyltransferase [Bradyrhizobium sp. 193]MCK1485645.1 acyltransferase [Bradyrhizobium sp. 193]
MLNLARRLINAIYKRVAPEAYARSIGVTMGSNCRLINVDFSTEPYLITLGDHVSATATRFETHDGGVWVFRDEFPNIDVVRSIRVGNNVFIGYGTIILPGVTIGDNVVIGAGSVVAKSIPSNTVAAGIPASVIKSIDDYRAKSLKSALQTKGMTPTQKRTFLLNELRLGR